MAKINNDVAFKHKRIVRVIVKYRNGNYGTGTGFFISKEGELLTCFHVAFGNELRAIRANQIFPTIIGPDEHTRLQTYYGTVIDSTEVEFSDGSRKTANLVSFDSKYDVAKLKITENIQTDFFEFDMKYQPILDDPIFFCGYQYAVGYDADKCPLAVNRGIISAIGQMEVGGDKYEHIQINSINLSGNSGSPLFLEESNNVIGMINGNMNWGADNFALFNEAKPPGLYMASNRVPLSIAYATSITIIRDSGRTL
jgi:S1-C subfamily serine protease